MAIEIRVPTLGESVQEATVGQWYKQPGDAIAKDEPLVELETDKVTIEVPASSDGVMGEQIAAEGETVGVDGLLGKMEAGGTGKAAAKAEAPKAAPATPEPAPAAKAAPQAALDHGPAVSRLAAESGVDPDKLSGSGKGGRATKGDMLAAIAGGGQASAPAPVQAPRPPSADDDAAREERVRMTKLRQTIARRLKEAQNTAAMLTTFNEVDMTEVMGLRKNYKDVFEKKHGVKLGFMGFFIKACLQALKEIPSVNAEIDGTDIIYKNYYHIGVAVGSPRGLVVPVVRDADQLSIAGVEKAIGGYGAKARDGTLSIAEMQGGTFTISNGGVYGSLMSTPILNAPQSAILGMHKIQERPMVVGGEIKIRPMMYLALSYDHRIIDGKEAVTFLVRVKESLEEPARLTLDL